MFIEYVKSPSGWVDITASESAVHGVVFVDKKTKQSKPNKLTKNCSVQLDEYFAGDRKVFDIPFDQEGTAFQNNVWQQLLSIPYGQLASYGDIAKKLKNPKAVRAVGAANGKNPVSILVPCHRVIGSNGKLTGYAGGLERKQWLLQHEGLGIYS